MKYPFEPKDILDGVEAKVPEVHWAAEKFADGVWYCAE